MEDLLEAWRTNKRINLDLIDRISDAGLGCTPSARGGRGVAGQFAHMHNNRVWQIEKRAVDLTAHLDTFGSREEEGAVSGRARPRAWSLGLGPALTRRSGADGRPRSFQTEFNHRRSAGHPAAVARSRCRGPGPGTSRSSGSRGPGLRCSCRLRPGCPTCSLIQDTTRR